MSQIPSQMWLKTALSKHTGSHLPESKLFLLLIAEIILQPITEQIYRGSLRLSHRSALRIQRIETNIMKWCQTDNPSSTNSSTMFKQLCQRCFLSYYNVLRTSASYFIFFSSKICVCSSFWCSNSDFRKVCS